MAQAGDREINGKSIMGVLTSQQARVRAIDSHRGEDELAAMNELKHL
jgi:phosphotransferase system HPr-like phosphotransfer protein